MVETEFSVVRFRGDKEAADAVYQGFDPRESGRDDQETADDSVVTGEDIAEEIVWCASRPPHVNIAQLCAC